MAASVRLTGLAMWKFSTTQRTHSSVSIQEVVSHAFVAQMLPRTAHAVSIERLAGKAAGLARQIVPDYASGAHYHSLLFPALLASNYCIGTGNAFCPTPVPVFGAGYALSERTSLAVGVFIDTFVANFIFQIVKIRLAGLASFAVDAFSAALLYLTAKDAGSSPDIVLRFADGAVLGRSLAGETVIGLVEAGRAHSVLEVVLL